MAGWAGGRPFDSDHAECGGVSFDSVYTDSTTPIIYVCIGYSSALKPVYLARSRKLKLAYLGPYGKF